MIDVETAIAETEKKIGRKLTDDEKQAAESLVTLFGLVCKRSDEEA